MTISIGIPLITAFVGGHFWPFFLVTYSSFINIKWLLATAAIFLPGCWLWCDHPGIVEKSIPSAGELDVSWHLGTHWLSLSASMRPCKSRIGAPISWQSPAAARAFPAQCAEKEDKICILRIAVPVIRFRLKSKNLHTHKLRHKLISV